MTLTKVFKVFYVKLVLSRIDVFCYSLNAEYLFYHLFSLLSNISNNSPKILLSRLSKLRKLPLSKHVELTLNNSMIPRSSSHLFKDIITSVTGKRSLSTDQQPTSTKQETNSVKKEIFYITIFVVVT